MGLRGPKPEPASVKRAKGNAGRRPIGDDPVPATEFGLIKPPSWLKNEGLKIWRDIAPRQIALKLLSPNDVEAFARYCKNFAAWLKMQAILDKDGYEYESESQHGKLRRVMPAFMVAERLEKKLEAAEDRFGRNPAERQRIFAARAGSGPAPDLFGVPAPQQRAPQPGAAKAEIRTSAVGFLQ